MLTDSLGSVVSSFNNPASGAVMQGNQLYVPYGNQRLKQGSLSTNKGFTGQYNDGLTGLDYYNARYYDPTIGLFLSADTVQGNVGGMDPYTYVGGNPESRTDPTGTRMIAPDGSMGWVNPFTGDLTTYIMPLEYSGYTPQLETHPHTTQAPYDPLKDKANSPQAKFGHETGLSTLLNPKASAGDKLKALWHGINNLLMAAGIFMGGPEADAGVAAADGVIEGGDGLLGGIEDTLSSCGGGLSFTPSTRVATAHGEQAIGTVHPGDKVRAYNPKTHAMELQPILHVWINHDNDLVDLTITTTHASHGKASKTTHEVIHTNKKHPFLTVEKGFLPVGKIKLGMHVVEADGQLGVITGWKVVPGIKTMYNLEVAQDHTFAVGTGLWVVHNCNPSYEQDLGAVESYEQARNKALSIVGDLGPDSEPYVGSLYSGEGKVVGRQSADRLVRWRLDYDPIKGTHINVEIYSAGKARAGGFRGYIQFPGDESVFESLLRHLNR